MRRKGYYQKMATHEKGDEFVLKCKRQRFDELQFQRTAMYSRNTDDIFVSGASENEVCHFLVVWRALVTICMLFFE